MEEVGKGGRTRSKLGAKLQQLREYQLHFLPQASAVLGQRSTLSDNVTTEERVCKETRNECDFHTTS